MKRERERLLKERAQEKDARRKVRRVERAERLARGEDPDLAPEASTGEVPAVDADRVDPT